MSQPSSSWWFRHSPHQRASLSDPASGDGGPTSKTDLARHRAPTGLMRQDGGMTLYAYDEARRALIATWDTGVGLAARTVAEVPQDSSGDDALGLADALTALSRLAWRTYTHPVSAAGSVELNSEGWRRQGERDAFAGVPDNLRKPNLPHDNGTIVQSYIMVEEAAHRVGRALHRIGDRELVDRVAEDVRHELVAVEQAELGGLSGRARQAVRLSRADASPLQVNAADELLREHPLGSSKLFHDVDPTAAAVAAAHWLQAAAEVASEVADCNPTMVVAEADNIEALAVRTPTLVMERMMAGQTPRKVVLDLIAAAMTVAEGKLPDPDGLVHEIEEARRKAARYGPGDDELLAGLMPPVTPLDPARPAQDLLEDLLNGIRGCWLLYRECADYGDDDLDDEDFTDDESADGQADEQIDEHFFEEVRIEAEVNRERLS